MMPYYYDPLNPMDRQYLSEMEARNIAQNRIESERAGHGFYNPSNPYPDLTERIDEVKKDLQWRQDVGNCPHDSPDPVSQRVQAIDAEINKAKDND